MSWYIYTAITTYIKGLSELISWSLKIKHLTLKEDSFHVAYTCTKMYHINLHRQFFKMNHDGVEERKGWKRWWKVLHACSNFHKVKLNLCNNLYRQFLKILEEYQDDKKKNKEKKKGLFPLPPKIDYRGANHVKYGFTFHFTFHGTEKEKTARARPSIISFPSNFIVYYNKSFPYYVISHYCWLMSWTILLKTTAYCTYSLILLS